MNSIHFNQELLSHANSLRYFALQFTKEILPAEDLLQDTMVKALVYKTKFLQGTNMKAWLFTIMRNIFINQYNKNKKISHVLDISQENYSINNQQLIANSIAESTINEKKIHEYIDQLETEYKTPFQLFIDGYKYQEIADYLHLPIGTVKSRIFIARKLLMAKISLHS